MRRPASTSCTMIWVSKSKSSVFSSNGIDASAATEYARYPEWNSESSVPSSEFSTRVRILLPANL